MSCKFLFIFGYHTEIAGTWWIIIILKEEEVIISRTVIKWMLIWTFFHMFALFTSYQQLPLFNESGDPRPQNFWPFVNFIDEYYVKNSNTAKELWETRLKFNGIFVNY